MVNRYHALTLISIIGLLLTALWIPNGFIAYIVGVISTLILVVSLGKLLQPLNEIIFRNKD